MPITNAILAGKISDLLDAWRVREQELQAWIAGTANGGPQSDGRYNLTDYLGVVRLTKSPARLEADVSGLVDSALVYRDQASVSATNAAASQSASSVSASQALSYRDTALLHRDDARAAESGAINALVNAQAVRDQAATSATNAAGSASAAAQDATDADTARIAAQAAQAAAEAARDAAQTWNPANYAALSATNTFTSGLMKIKAATNTAYVEFLDAAGASLGYVGDGSAGSNDMFLYSVNAGRLYGFGGEHFRLDSGMVTRHYGDFRSRGHGRFTGWYGAPSADEQGTALEVGASAGTSYVLSYNRATVTYQPLYIQGSSLTLGNPLIVATTGTSASTRNTEIKTDGQPNVGYGGYAGSWRPSLTIQGETSSHYMFIVGPESNASNAARIMSTRQMELWAASTLVATADTSGYLLANNWIRLGPGGQGIYSSTNSAHLYPNTSFTYAGWNQQGIRNSYGGIAFGDISGVPTIMANSSATGLYWQSPAKWSFYSDQTYLRIYDLPLKNDLGAMLWHESSSYRYGGITMSTAAASGSPAGNGAIWIQHAA